MTGVAPATLDGTTLGGARAPCTCGAAHGHDATTHPLHAFATAGAPARGHAGDVRRLVLSVGLLVVVGTGCSTYVQHRAALVPHPTPVQTTGQGAAWRGTASLGATNIADPVAPGVGDPNAGIAIPSRQLRGSLGLWITRNLAIGVFREQGLASSAQPIKSTLPPLDDDPVVGHGYSITYSVPTQSPWRVGLSLEMAAWSVPWVEYSTCIDFCSEPIVTMSRGRTGVGSIAIGIVPSYQLGDWTFFAGATGRNHPTLEEKVINHGEWPDVEGGPLNAVIHAGAAYEAGERVQFVAQMHQTVTRDPVVYGPSFGFSVVIGLGRRYPKVAPIVPDEVTGPPGSAPTVTRVQLSPEERRAQAVALTDQAREAARRGECGEVQALDARVRGLDPAIHANAFLADPLIAYCVSP